MQPQAVISQPRQELEDNDGIPDLVSSSDDPDWTDDDGEATTTSEEEPDVEGVLQYLNGKGFIGKSNGKGEGKSKPVGHGKGLSEFPGGHENP